MANDGEKTDGGEVVVLCRDPLLTELWGRIGADLFRRLGDLAPP